VTTKVGQVCEQFACTYCGAGPGQKCVSPASGRTMYIAHYARFEAATEAGLLPLPDDQR
jgi:hypothetical protein